MESSHFSFGFYRRATFHDSVLWTVSGELYVTCHCTWKKRDPRYWGMFALVASLRNVASFYKYMHNTKYEQQAINSCKCESDTNGGNHGVNKGLSVWGVSEFGLVQSTVSTKMYNVIMNRHLCVFMLLLSSPLLFHLCNCLSFGTVCSRFSTKFFFCWSSRIISCLKQRQSWMN